MSGHENHNRVVPQLLRLLVNGTDGEAEAMVALESLILGAMLHFRPDPRHAAEFLDSMTQRVIERMAEC